MKSNNKRIKELRDKWKSKPSDYDEKVIKSLEGVKMKEELAYAESDRIKALEAKISSYKKERELLIKTLIELSKEQTRDTKRGE